MRDHSSAIVGGAVPAPDPEDILLTVVAWARHESHAVVRVTNRSDVAATVTAHAAPYAGWLVRRLRLLSPHAGPRLRDQALAAVAPGATEDVTVPVARPDRRTVVDVSASAAGHRSARSSWLLAARSR